jgi:RNA polymerase sigma factor (sigma-70 family)
MDAEQLFLDNLPLVDRILASTARRHRLTKEEAEDFASVVKLKLIANDYEVLRTFEGRSSLGGFLVAVVQRAYIDHCNHLWGKWRPSAEARRLGPLAVRLDTLLHRDGLTLEEACARAAPEEREPMRQLAARLPQRVRRRIDGEEKLGSLPAAGGSPEGDLLEREREAAAGRLQQALAQAVERLGADDRLLLQLRLYEGVSLVSVARSFGHEPRQVYRRWETLIGTLRKSLEKGGLDARQVAWALGAEMPSGGEGDASRPSNRTGLSP